MKGIQPQQLRKIYAIGRSLGMDSEDLHVLVDGQQGKASMKELEYSEAEAVIAELKDRQKAAGIKPPPRKRRSHPETPGGVTKEQQSKAWKLMYLLEEHDPGRGGATLGDRLCGIIKKQTGMDAHPAQPFRFMSMEQGRQLIETLRSMATNAEKKALRKGGAVHG